MRLRHLFAVIMLFGAPATVRAQDDRGASVGAALSATSMDARTELSFSAAFGYRFSRVVGLELEATVVPSLKSSFPDSDRFSILGDRLATAILIYPVPTYTNADGRVVILSNNVRVTVPTTSPRLEPYFVAGGGIANVRRTADFVYTIYPLSSDPFLGLTAGGLIPKPSTTTQKVTSSSVDLALTLGGGLGVRVSRQMTVDADLRMFRLLGNKDRSSGRFGVGVRYLF